MVCIEDLQVRNMSASASGTIEAPGAHVSIRLDVGLSTVGIPVLQGGEDVKLNYSPNPLPHRCT